MVPALMQGKVEIFVKQTKTYHLLIQAFGDYTMFGSPSDSRKELQTMEISLHETIATSGSMVETRSIDSKSELKQTLPRRRSLLKQARSSGVISMSQMKSEPNLRFILWIDGIGGYLVCIGNQFSIGQNIPNTPVDIPLRGSLSSKHVEIHCSGERYTLNPLGHDDVAINGKPVQDSTMLSNQCSIQFAEDLELDFCLPNPLSPTAKLTPPAATRVEPSVDAIFLMRGTLILGPSDQAHIVCPEWTNDLVLFYQNGNFGIKSREDIQIDGINAKHRSSLTFDSRIDGENFSLSLESL